MTYRELAEPEKTQFEKDEEYVAYIAPVVMAPGFEVSEFPSQRATLRLLLILFRMLLLILKEVRARDVPRT